MNINSLQDSLEYVAYSGNTIPSEQCMILQNSLTILQNENHFQETYFWGKIFGTDNDYYLAFGTAKDALKERTFYYSTNMFDWGLLPKAKKKAKMLTLLCKELFLGDATFRVNVLREDPEATPDTHPPAPAEVAPQPPAAAQSTTQAARPSAPATPSLAAPPPTPTEGAQASTIAQPSKIAQPPMVQPQPCPAPALITEILKEEDRLSAVVSLINDEAAMVPRGALFKRTDGFVVYNSAFKGLPKEEAKHINNYYHYRIPQQRWNINVLTQDDYNFAYDFLDTTNTDIPEGNVWTLQLHDAGRVSVLHNLYWPGMTCYHRVGTPNYGFMYTGLGKKNMDLPFMVY